MSQNILATTKNNFGIIGLNRPEALNALSIEMLAKLEELLLSWQEDPNIKAVFLHSESPKAFCAGGDVKAVVQNQKDRPNFPEEYFKQEYRVDYLIHSYPKPIVCWGESWVLGGGWGLFAGASHRIVKENSALAMPETAIGFFPDVAASWFLNKLPIHLALFICLTGARITGNNAFHLGLADYYLGLSKKDSVLNQLLALELTGDRNHNDQWIDNVLKASHDSTSTESIDPADLKKLETIIDIQDPKGSIERLFRFKPKTEYWREATDKLAAASPFSLLLTFEMFRLNHQISSVKEAFERDLRLALFCAKHPDFTEGVSAKLIEKRPPFWESESLEQVDLNKLNIAQMP